MDGMRPRPESMPPSFLTPSLLRRNTCRVPRLLTEARYLLEGEKTMVLMDLVVWPRMKTNLVTNPLTSKTDR